MIAEQDLYISNNWVKGQGDTLESVDPATGKVIWSGNSSSQKQIDMAITAARSALANWMILNFETRLNYLNKFTENITKSQAELAEAIAQETGKPLWEAKTEITAMIGKTEVTKQSYLDRCKEVSKDMQGAVSITRHKPHGVVVVLGPFNFPGHLPNGHIIPALLAGNTVVFKPSELTPYFSLKMMQCWHEAGLPSGVINMVLGDAAIGKYLVDHNAIDGIFFTGSSGTGLKIQNTIVEQPQRILALEMGGNNPLVVDEPGDIDAAVYHTIQSAYLTAGQRCSCARRLIVTKNEIGEQFVQRLIDVTKKIKVGAYNQQPEPFMGSLISNHAAEQVLKSYNNLVNAGAKILVPLVRTDDKLAFLTPAIIDVTNLKSQDDEEIFGPLLRLKWVNNFTDAINEANNTTYGLTAGLLSDSESNYKQFYQQVHAGIINWNRPITGASSSAPFGGVGKSGNYRPSAYYAVDYCAYPVASMEEANLHLPATLSPGINLDK